MRIALLLLAAWTGSAVVTAGLLVALFRGSGGTAAPSLGAVPERTARRRVHLPGPRGAVQAAPDLVGERR